MAIGKDPHTIKKIHKYSIAIEKVRLWLGPFKILLFGQQGGEFKLWIEEEKDGIGGFYDFMVLPTGATVPAGWRHIGSVQMPDEEVWHAFLCN